MRRSSSPGSKTLKRLHRDPAFAAARDERARARMIERQAEMQRLSKAARRGVDVPPELEADWKALSQAAIISN